MTAPIQVNRIADIAGHAAKMDEPLVSYRLLEPGGRAAPPAPAFMFGPFSAALARTIYGQIEVPELGVYAMADAFVAPTGIAVRDGVAFAGAALNLPAEHVGVITRRLAESSLPIRDVAGPLLPLFGPAEEIYTQLITDYLPRLWQVQQAGFDIGALRILVPAHLPDAAADIVDALGFSAEKMIRYAHWAEVIRTDLLLLPTVPRRYERLSPRFGEATRFWTRSLPSADIAFNRIFIRAANAPRNEDRLEAIAAEHGFTTVSLTGLDVVGRAAVFTSASHIVGVYGAALFDCVFAQSGTRILVLRDTARDPGFLLIGIAAAMGHTQGYVFIGEDATVDEADFRRGLEVLVL